MVAVESGLSGPTTEAGARMIETGEQALEIGFRPERGIAGAGPLLEQGPKWVRGESASEGICKRGCGPFLHPDPGDAIGQPFLGPATAESDDGAFMGEGFHTDQTEGFVSEHREKNPLAAAIPGIEIGGSDLAEEPDP